MRPIGTMTEALVMGLRAAGWDASYRTPILSALSDLESCEWTMDEIAHGEPFRSYRDVGVV